MNILLAAATEGEVAPTLAWLRGHTVETDKECFTFGAASVQLCLTGVGILAATETLARALHTVRYDFAVQAGIAGSFDRGTPLGDVVCVANDIPADLGAEDADGRFLDLYALGLAGKDDAPFADGLLHSTGLEHALGKAFSRIRRVSGITVQTVSGTEKTVSARSTRYGADVETMEGAPFHYCCLRAGVPFIQLRAISNYMEPRNREAWKLEEAIAGLNKTLTSWLTELAAPSLRAN